MLESFMGLKDSSKLSIYMFLFLIITFLYWVVLPPDFLVPALYVIPLFLIAIGSPWKKSWIIIPLTAIMGVVRDLYFLDFTAKALIQKYIIVSIVLLAMFILGSKLKIAYDRLNAAKDELEMLYNREKQLSNIDYLTDLGNHRFFQQNLEMQVRLAQERDHELSLIIFDLDNFKKFNDTLGHQAGDILLKDIGKIIKQCIREADIACRYGGEEFVVLLPKTSAADAREVGERIRKTVEDTKFIIGEKSPGQCCITISGGVASFPTDAENGVDLIKAADERLYIVKRGLKNQVA